MIDRTQFKLGLAWEIEDDVEECLATQLDWDFEDTLRDEIHVVMITDLDKLEID